THRERAALRRAPTSRISSCTAIHSEGITALRRSESCRNGSARRRSRGRGGAESRQSRMSEEARLARRIIRITDMRGMVWIALPVVLAAVLEATADASPRPVALFVIPREEPVAPELTPAGQAAVREGRKLRARFLAALRKVEGVTLV